MCNALDFLASSPSSTFDWHFSGVFSLVDLLTRTAQSLPVKQTGYCGLMLPVLEDLKLAERNFSFSQLLSVSAVCGVGIDCLPIEGATSVDAISRAFRDVAAMARRGQKPLSCRLFPCPGKRRGEKTDFENPYLCNATVMAIEHLEKEVSEES